MKHNQKGFTMVEMCVSFILFAILLEGLWGFFTNIYVDYMQFNRQTILNSEATTVENYIKDYIRQSDKIEIELDGSGNLKKMIRTVNKPDGTEKEKAMIEVALNTTPAGEQGKCSINYYGPNSSNPLTISTTPLLISDKIENIKATTNTTLKLLEFTCEIHKVGQTNERLKVTKKFTESIAYKTIGP